MNTEHFTRISRITWQLILYSYNQYSGLIALAPVSNTVLHRFASPLRKALSSSVVTISLPSRPHSLSAIRNTLPRLEKKTVQFLPFPGLIQRLSHLSNLLHYSMQRWIPLECFFPSYGKVLETLTSEAARVFTLQGAVALGYTAPSWRLRVPSSHQVRRQSVQVDDNHLCHGMPLNPVYDVYPGDNDVGAFPACLQLGWFFLYRLGRYSHTLSPSGKPAELASWV